MFFIEMSRSSGIFGAVVGLFGVETCAGISHPDVRAGAIHA